MRNLFVCNIDEGEGELIASKKLDTVEEIIEAIASWMNERSIQHNQNAIECLANILLSGKEPEYGYKYKFSLK